jgi:hypothetical protein
VRPADEWTEHRPEQIWDDVLKGRLVFQLYPPITFTLNSIITCCNMRPTDEWTEQVWDDVIKVWLVSQIISIIQFQLGCSNWFYYQMQCATRRWVDRASARADLRRCAQGAVSFPIISPNYIFSKYYNYLLQCATRRWVDQGFALAGLRQRVDWFPKQYQPIQLLLRCSNWLAVFYLLQCATRRWVHQASALASLRRCAQRAISFPIISPNYIYSL